MDLYVSRIKKGQPKTKKRGSRPPVWVIISREHPPKRRHCDPFPDLSSPFASGPYPSKGTANAAKEHIIATHQKNLLATRYGGVK